MAHVRNQERAVLYTEIGVPKERQYRDYLVLVPESCDERTHRSAPSQIMQQFQFILNTEGAAGDIDLFQRNVSRLFLLAGR